MAIVGTGPIAEAAAASAHDQRRHRRHRPSFDAAADALLVAGKAGVLEHDLATTVQAKLVVPLTPVPVTARALADPRPGRRVVVPDFLSTAGPLLAAVDPDGGDPMLRVHDAVAALAGEGTGALDGRRRLSAEEHLRTWQDALPFGRPLA